MSVEFVSHTVCCFVVEAIEINNITASVNSNVSLTCAMESGSTARWTLYPGNYAYYVTLYSGLKMNPKFTRFSVSSDEETGHSELMIYGVQHADAGKYKCSFRKINSSNSQTVGYTLTVIG